MKLIMVTVLMITSLLADKVIVNSIGCKNIDALIKLNKDDANDPLKLAQYAIQNNCTILSPDDQIKVIDKLVNSSQYGLVLSLVQFKKTGDQLYVHKKNIYIEQSGDKNKLKF